MPDFSFLTTYPPTRCGIATFSESLADALTAQDGTRVDVVRLMDALDVSRAAGAGVHSSVVLEWGAGRGTASRAARALEAADVAIVQHEYGIYPGIDGEDVLDVLRELAIPSILVLHTVLDAPTIRQREIVERAVALASRVVVMGLSARRLLLAEYDIDARDVVVIPHGVPDWQSVVPSDVAHQRTMLTWGLIGPGKGIEWGIRALTDLADLDPPVRYEVLGATHPKVLAHEGEAYRDSLHSLAAELGVADRVVFDDRYLDRDALARRVAAADLVLLPYESGTQATSGVLAEAVGAGKPVVATGFPHALELLADGVGTVVAHRSSPAIAAAVRAVLLHADTVAALGPAPRDATTSWGVVGERFRALGADLLVEWSTGRWGRTA